MHPGQLVTMTCAPVSASSLARLTASMWLSSGKTASKPPPPPQQVDHSRLTHSGSIRVMPLMPCSTWRGASVRPMKRDIWQGS